MVIYEVKKSMRKKLRNLTEPTRVKLERPDTRDTIHDVIVVDVKNRRLIEVFSYYYVYSLLSTWVENGYPDIFVNSRIL